MGLFFRKSIKLGPVRLNLGKSGIGASVGVKGLRAGTTARGRGYVSGGRGGVYFRKSLGQQSAGPGISTDRQVRIVAIIGGLIFLIVLCAIAPSLALTFICAGNGHRDRRVDLRALGFKSHRT